MLAIVRLFIFSSNLLFLLINGMKGILTANPSGLTFFGLFLACVTALYLLPAVAKDGWTYASRKSSPDAHEHVGSDHV